MAGPQQAGLAPANVLRSAFRPRDDEILVEKENEIEAGEERRRGGFNVRARAVLLWGKRGRSLWRGIGATPFFLGQPPDRPADSFEGAQLLGGELAGGRRGVAGHLPGLQRHRLFVRRLGDSLLLRRRGQADYVPRLLGGSRFRYDQPLMSARKLKNVERAGDRGLAASLELNGAAGFPGSIGRVETLCQARGKPRLQVLHGLAEFGTRRRIHPADGACCMIPDEGCAR